MQKSEPPYVAPFIRRLLRDATEAEIQEASENLRGYLLALYDLFLERDAARPRRDSPVRKHDVRFPDADTSSAPL